MAARDALIEGVIDLIRRNGVAGTGVAELLTHSGISRRSIYLNFPGGKSQLVAEATRVAGGGMSQLIEKATSGGQTPQNTLDQLSGWWRRFLTASDFVAGCPIVAAALGRSESPEAADAAAEAISHWIDLLSSHLVERNVAPDVARSLAITVVSALEGAVIVSQATGSTEPIDATSKHLTELLDKYLLSAEAPAY